MRSLEKKNVIWNIIGTTISSFNSLFFLIIVTRINGITKAGIFSFSFSFACLFYIIGIYSGRVFQVTDSDGEKDHYAYINNHLVSCFLMLFFSFIFCIVRSYSVYKVLIVMLLICFKAIEAFSETLYAIIQEHKMLYKVGVSLFVKAILGLTAFFVVDLFTKNLILSILGIVVANLLMVIFYDFKNTGLKICDYSFDKKKVFRLFRIGFMPFLFTFLNLYLISLSKYIIDFVSSEELQTIYGVLSMPATVVSMFAQFVIHPVLLQIKESVKNKNKNSLIKTIYNMTGYVFLFGIFSIIVSFFIGIPVLNIIYGINLSSYRLCLIIVLIGAVFYSIATLLSNVLTACRKLKSQTFIYLILSILCSIISLYLIKLYSIKGAIYSYLISMFLLFASFIVLMVNTLKKEFK